MLLCATRGRGKAPGLRPRLKSEGSSLGHLSVPCAFTAPLGLVRPLARARVRLLGPCFKTGRRERRPTRDGLAACLKQQGEARCTRRPGYPPAAGTELAGTREPLGPPNFTRPLVRQRAVRRVRASGKVQPIGSSARRWSVLADRPSQPRASSRLNFRWRFSRVPPFTAAQFHVLLNSLFKVLFNFPSRYLFAIGLGVVFSLTWSLPRALSCTPKQLDSGGEPAPRGCSRTGLSPSAGSGPCQGGLGRRGRGARRLPRTPHSARPRRGRQFGAGLCPFHSPLLRASLLFSLPPLINMLKFGGSSCLRSGRKSSRSIRRGALMGCLSRC